MALKPDAERIAKALAPRLQALRKSRGLKQADLELVLGVSHGQISNYEKGESLITLDNLYRAARFYDLPISELLPDGLLTSTPRARGMADAPAAFAREGEAQNRVGQANDLAAAFLEIDNAEVRASLFAHVLAVAKLR